MKRYLVNEIFRSLQGEGARAGTVATFVRFAKCNLACNVAEHGFDCDTDFDHGDWYELDALLAAVRAVGPSRWIILTGGEPALQLDGTLVGTLHDAGYRLAIETNGTRPLPPGIDWVCVSPKPGTRVMISAADEVKFVLRAGQRPHDVSLRSSHRLVSPAFKGDEFDPEALAWCIQWVLDHPTWRLSVQQHKQWGVR